MTNIMGLCSAYSLLYGIHKPHKLLDRAAVKGAKVVSICDLNNLYGVHAFIEAAKERNIRPVIGTALTMSNEKIVYCFVENRAGFGRLCEILTERNKDKERFDPLPFLLEDAAGLVLASADALALECLAGRVKRLYAAVTPTDIRAVEKSRKLGVPLAFLDNSLFLDEGDFAVHRVVRAIGLLKTVGNLAAGDTANKGRILRASGELPGCLLTWSEAYEGTEEIAELWTLPR